MKTIETENCLESRICFGVSRTCESQAAPEKKNSVSFKKSRNKYSVKAEQFWRQLLDFAYKEYKPKNGKTIFSNR